MAILQRLKNYLNPPKQLISTPAGLRNVADLKIGDVVLGRDLALLVVEKIEKVKTNDFYFKINNEFSFFANQSIYVNGKCVHAKDIKVGDFIINIYGKQVTVEKIEPIKLPFYFYRLEIGGDHTYYINGILCHNASRYWNPAANANWADANVFAETDGGDPTGISTPTSADNVYFTSTNTYQCTLTALANCADLDFRGGTGFTGILTGGNGIQIYGNLALQSGMTISGFTGGFLFKATSGTKTVRTDGLTLQCGIFWQGSGGTFQLFDNLTTAGNITYTFGTFDVNGKLVTLTGGTNQTLSGNMTFADLTRTGNAVKTDGFKLGGNITVTGTLTINGNSVANRIYVASNSVGTQRTLTAATVVVTNADFEDIVGAGAGSWDLSGQNVGNGGNCSGIIFPTPTTWYYHEAEAGANNFSTVEKWFTATNGGGSVATRPPLLQDTARFDSNSFDSGSKTVSQDMPRIGAINWAGVTNSPAFTISQATSVYGSFDLDSGMGTFTCGYVLTLKGRGSYTITSGGKSFVGGNLVLDAYGTIGTVVYTFQDDTTIGTLVINNGQFSDGGHTVTISTACYTQGATAKGVILAGGTWVISSASTNSWNFSANTNLTITVSAVTTIKFTSSAAADASFDGGGKTYSNFWNARTGTNAVLLKNNDTFNDLKIDAGQKFTITTGKNVHCTTWTGSGTSGNLITLRSSTTTNATLTKDGGGVVSADYLDIDYITGSPVSTWYMGRNSTDGGHNTNIYFTAFFTQVCTEVIKVVSSLTNVLQFNKTLTQIVNLISSILKSAGRTFTQSLITIGTFSVSQNYETTRSENVNAISLLANQTSRSLVQTLTITPVLSYLGTLFKTFLDNIKILPIYTNLATLFKVLSETIQTTSLKIITISRSLSDIVVVVSQKLFSFGRNLTQNILVISVFSDVLTSLRTLTQSIIVAGAKTFLASRSFIQNILINSVLSNISTLYKVLTNIVLISSQRLSTTGRTIVNSLLASSIASTTLTSIRIFTQNIVISPVFANIKTFLRVLSQTITAVDNLLKLTGRTIVVSVSVGWNKINSISRNITEIINVTSVLSIINTFLKTLTDTLTVISSKFISFGKTIVNSLVVLPNTLWDITRQFSETIIVRAASYYQTTRQFIENVIVIPVYSKILTAVRVMSETFTLGWSALKNTSRLFVDSFIVAGSVIHQSIKIFSEVVLVGIIYTNILSAIRILAESIKIIGSQINQTSRILSDSIIALDNRIITGIKILSDSIVVVGNFIKGLFSKVINNSLVIIGQVTFNTARSLGESLIVTAQGTFESIKVFTESIIAGVQDFYLGAGKLLKETIQISSSFVLDIARTFGEIIIVSGSVVLESIKIFSEIILVTASFVRNMIAKLLLETVVIVMGVTKSLGRLLRDSFVVVSNQVLSTTKVLIDSIVAVATFAKAVIAKILYETLIVVPVLVIGVASRVLLETVVMAVNLVTGGAFYKVLIQSVNIIGNVYNQGVLVFTEIVVVIGQWFKGLVSKLFIEPVKIYASINRYLTRLFTQIIIANARVQKQTGKMKEEEIIVTPTLGGFAVGKLLKEVVSIGWDKIKLVLNGIAAGLWKKIARITNGVWKKISRND